MINPIGYYSRVNADSRTPFTDFLSAGSTDFVSVSTLKGLPSEIEKRFTQDARESPPTLVVG